MSLFCGYVGLTYGDIGLFCGDIGLICRDIRFFYGEVGLFCGLICESLAAATVAPALSLYDSLVVCRSFAEIQGSFAETQGSFVEM